MTKVAEAAALNFGQDGDGVTASARAPRRDDSGRPLYTTLIVRNVAVADNPDIRGFQAGDDELLQKMLIGRLQHDNAFPYVIDGKEGTEVSAAQHDGRALELVPSIVAYRGGKMHGATVKVNVMLRDMVTKRPVQAFVEKGSASSGMFKGSSDDAESKALKEVSDNIADEVKKYGHPKREHESHDKHEAKKHDTKKDQQAQEQSYTLPN
jgi:hypothetical protein